MHNDNDDFRPAPIDEILTRAQKRLARPAARKKTVWIGRPGEIKPLWDILGEEPPSGWRPPEPEPHNPAPGFGIPFNGPDPDPGFAMPTPPGQATGIPFPRMRPFDEGQPFAPPVAPDVYGPPAPSTFAANGTESGLSPIGRNESPGGRIGGFLGDVVDGAGSYFSGLGKFGSHLADGAAIRGVPTQEEALEANETFGSLAKKLVANPEYIDDAAKAGWQAIKENPGKVAGRFGTGAGIGIFARPGIAIPLGLAAMYGDIIQAIKNGANAREAIAAALQGSKEIPSDKPPTPTSESPTPPNATPAPEEKPK